MRDPDFDADAPATIEGPGPAGRLLGWIGGHERGVIAAAVALQLAVILSMVARNALPTLGSPTVLLRVVPVDPRDLMRGQYVTLGYDISRSPRAFEPGTTVYAVLVPEADGRHYRGGAILAARPGAGRFIRGTSVGGNRIRYGIESYFVQEGRGKEYEAAVLRHRLSAEVALAADGTPALRRLVVE